MFYYNYKKLLFLESNDLVSSFDEEYMDVLKNSFLSYKLLQNANLNENEKSIKL